MGKSIAFAALALVTIAVVAVHASESKAEVEATVHVTAEQYAAAEAQHYAALWTAARSEHVTFSTSGELVWRCCRPCGANTVPILHEAFEQDKDDVPEMKKGPPPPGGDKGDKSFVELSASTAASTAAVAVAAGKGRGQGRGSVRNSNRNRNRNRSAFKSRKDSEFEVSMRRKAIAQADALAGHRVDSTAYSCCNQCPDLMYPFPGTWNRPSAYSYAPPPKFRFTTRKPTAQRSLVETASIARAATASSSGEGSGEGSDRYVPTNPHNLPQYYYWETVEKAAPPRSYAARDGKFDPPIRAGASPVWHPPPPPHDDIFRVSRSPNLHDGADLKTPPILPPCCDYCMSTYFPHIINDEWQLPKKVPYTIGPFSKAFVEVASTSTSTSSATATSTGNDDAMTSAEAAAKLLPSHKSDPKHCCHKCIRKDIEDTDWQVYALPPPKSTIPPAPKMR